MERKEAIQYITLLLGGIMTGVNSILSGCRQEDKKLFSAGDIACLDEIADTILPETATPGAKAAKVGSFMAVMVNDCYDEKEQAIFKKGMNTINDLSSSKYGSSFVKLSPGQRYELLLQLDAEQKEYTNKKKDEDPAHYFRMMKELTLFGYFTSQPGVTKAKRYMPVPGKYIGCVDYHKGEKAIV